MTIKPGQNHLQANLVLATPVMLGQIGHIATSLADNVMVGQVSSLNLAASSFANNIYSVFLLFTIGLTFGVTPLVSNALGERNIPNCRKLYQAGAQLSVIASLFLPLMMVAFSALFSFLGQTPEVLELATPYYYQLCAGMMPTVWFLSAKHFSEGLAETKPAMTASIVGNSVNIGLNYILIYGKFGFPAMGLLGAGWATLVSKFIMFFVLIVIVKNTKASKSYFQKIKFRPDFGQWRNLLKIGLPVSFQYVMEVGAFTAGMIIVGTMGSLPLAAHQIALGITSLTYVMASGIASAASIRVSYFAGNKDFQSLQKTGNTSFVMVWMFMLCCAAIIGLAANYIPMLYVNEHEVIKLASGLLVICAIYQIFDGTQVTAMGALRGLQDVRKPTLIALVSYWVVGLPLCYLLGVKLNMGVHGVWLGFMGGLATAAIWLYLRYIGLVKETLKSSGKDK
jgi:multidrug resistance protein, MATE family